MMLMKRSVGSKHTRNNQDLVRQWSDQFTLSIINALQTQFHNQFEVVLFSDRNLTMMRCHECQMQAFHSADVVIGVHGKLILTNFNLTVNKCYVPSDNRCWSSKYGIYEA